MVPAQNFIYAGSFSSPPVDYSVYFTQNENKLDYSLVLVKDDVTQNVWKK